jgi:hypothetical protein
MANIVIRITAVSGSTVTLQQGNGTSGDTTTVDQSDVVRWVAANNVPITLTGITRDTGSGDVFDPSEEPPAPPPPGQPQTRQISGTIASNATGSESYTIHWQNNTNGRYYSMDPTLRVNN